MMNRIRTNNAISLQLVLVLGLLLPHTVSVRAQTATEAGSAFVVLQMEGASWEVPSCDESIIASVLASPICLPGDERQITRTSIFHSVAWGNADNSFALEIAQAWMQNQLPSVEFARRANIFPLECNLAGRVPSFSWYGFGTTGIHIRKTEEADLPFRAGVKYAEEFWDYATEPERAFSRFVLGRPSRTPKRTLGKMSDGSPTLRLSYHFDEENADAMLFVRYERSSGQTPIVTDWSVQVSLHNENTTIVKGARIMRLENANWQLPATPADVLAVYWGHSNVSPLEFIDHTAQSSDVNTPVEIPTPVESPASAAR